MKKKKERGNPMHPPKKAGIRRHKTSVNPYKKTTTINISESFEDIQQLIQKALKIVAKQSV